MDTLLIIAKVVTGGIVLLVYTRVTGRSQISPLSATDVVSSVVIGSLISEGLFDDEVALWQILLAVLVWSLFFMAVRELKSHRVAAELALDGKKVDLMRAGRLLPENFKRTNLTVRDFETLIHQEGIAAIDDLYNVWFEPNGKLSIVKKGEEEHSQLLMENGQVYDDALDELDKTRAWLAGQLAQQGYHRPEDVFCAEWHSGRLWVYPVEDE